MITLKYIGPTSNDCTAPYDVILDREYIFSEFIQAILVERSDEWGEIRVLDGKSIFGDPVLDYKKGVLLSSIPDELKDKTVISARAHGGWSYMSYRVKL